jgi:hypothetical protein
MGERRLPQGHPDLWYSRQYSKNGAHPTRNGSISLKTLQQDFEKGSHYAGSAQRL